MPQVTVHHQHLLSLDGKADGYVHGQEGLTASRIERGEDNDVGPAALVRHELQVGAQHTERLVDDVPAALLHDNRVRFGRFPEPFLLPADKKLLRLPG